MKSKKITPSGISSDRLKNDPQGRETAFVKQWEHEHGHSCGDILAHLLCVPCQEDDVGRFRGTLGQSIRQPIGGPTERDRIIAATLIQWLGTNVGFDFVGQALVRAGYKYPEKANDR